MTFYEENRSYKAWFEYAEPGLLTNRTIRNFLAEYRSETWPDVVKLALLYGIVTLKKTATSQRGRISLEEIRRRVRQLETADCVETRLPQIQEKMKDLKDDVQEILEVFDGGESTKPRSDHRPPEKEKVNEAETAMIYPEWWGDGSKEEKVESVQPQKNPPRAPPRLCYSLPPKESNDVAADDIIEPKYHMHPIYLPPPVSSEQRARETAPSVKNITEAFLNNPWTSSLFHESLSSSRVPLPEEIATENKTAPTTATSYDPWTPCLSTTGPKSSAFWVDFRQSTPDVVTPTPPKSGDHGCVLDFGHLDSPRFPSAVRSLNSTPTEESLEQPTVSPFSLSDDGFDMDA